VIGYFVSDGLGTNGYTLDEVRFADGTVWSLADIKALVLVNTVNGTGSADNLMGTAGIDKILGFAGNDILDGGLGADTLLGGTGDDTYVVNEAGDVVTENANEGVDTVQSAVSWMLGSNVENLLLTGGNASSGTGNALANVLTGNSAANTLNGGAGNDTLDGGAGADVLAGELGNDTYLFGLGDGQDTIVDTQGQSTLSFRSGIAATDLRYSLLNGNLIVKVGSGTDQITLVGWQTATERVGTITFADGSSMVLNESVLNHLPVAAADNASLTEDMLTVTGNVLTNDTDVDVGTVLTVTGAGTLQGLYGSLVLAANGNYTYTQNTPTQALRSGQSVTDVFSYGITDNVSVQPGTASSSLTITISGANDTPTLVTAAVNQQAIETQAFTYVLPANMFADVDTGDSLTLRANLAGGAALPTWLTFNAATRTFAGTPPNTASGLLSIQVSATDAAGAAVSTAFSLDITNFINGTTAADTLTGTAARDVIYGLAGNDTINGGAGADTMVGGLGNDAYTVDDVGDTVLELAGEGTDTVNASISYTLTDNLENLTLTGSAAINATGNALNNILNGNTGNNILNGGAGADTMAGGAGNDTYYVDNASDITTEAAGAGTDLVIASVNWTLATNFENLTLEGLANINATGNTLANTLRGNAGNNLLDGGAGADTMLGGAGDDTYVVDVAGDVITENLNEGTDLVQTGIAYTLGANLENLTLTGSGAISGTGNALANVLVGNTAANTLTGGAGNDTLDGKAGADSLVGGVGSDTYLLGRGYGIDTITENDATAGNTDIAKFDATVATNQLWFVRVGNNLEVSIIGTTDKFVMTNWYLGSQYHVEQFRSGDGKTLLDSQVQNLVSAMAAFTPPAAGVTTLPANYATTLQPVLAANWV
jgi:VCBS repeat-containing protein